MSERKGRKGVREGGREGEGRRGNEKMKYSNNHHTHTHTHTLTQKVYRL